MIRSMIWWHAGITAGPVPGTASCQWSLVAQRPPGPPAPQTWTWLYPQASTSEGRCHWYWPSSWPRAHGQAREASVHSASADSETRAWIHRLNEVVKLESLRLKLEIQLTRSRVLLWAETAAGLPGRQECAAMLENLVKISPQKTFETLKISLS